ncbi:MAG: glycosyltransferase family 4 protein, partial [Candidatus Helarchaeota archaeon]
RKILSKYWFISKLAFLLADFVIANSLAGLKANNLTPSNKNKCIYNGFDFNRVKILVDKKTIRKRFGISTKYVVGMVANFEDQKDYQTYLSAAQRILESRNDVTFLCIGDGYNLKSSKELIKKELSSNILFLGRQTDIESIINIFDIGVLSCNTNGHAEGISNSILEYMALAKPVIATDSGGTKEIVNNRKTGYIISPFSINEMEERINNLLNNEELRNQMGIEGQNRIINYFCNKIMVNSFFNIYRELLA